MFCCVAVTIVVEICVIPVLLCFLLKLLLLLQLLSMQIGVTAAATVNVVLSSWNWAEGRGEDVETQASHRSRK